MEAFVKESGSRLWERMS